MEHVPATGNRGGPALVKLKIGGHQLGNVGEMSGLRRIANCTSHLVTVTHEFAHAVPGYKSGSSGDQDPLAHNSTRSPATASASPPRHQLVLPQHPFATPHPIATPHPFVPPYPFAPPQRFNLNDA